MRPTLPVFTATGSRTYFFQPGPAGLLTSAEGCNQQTGAPLGGLATSPATGVCQTGSMGYAVNYGADIPAEFDSAALASPLTVGGSLSVMLYLVDPAQPLWQTAFNPRIDVEVDAIDANGELLLAVASGEWTVCNTVGGSHVCNSGPQPVAGTYTMQIPAITLPAGSRISVLARETAAVASSSRTVYGGSGIAASFANAGLTFTTGTLQ